MKLSQHKLPFWRRFLNFLGEVNPISDLDSSIFLRYQVLIFGVYTLVLLPLYKLAIKFSLWISGISVVSSGDYQKLIFSFGGLILVITSLLMMILFVSLEIVPFFLIAKELYLTGSRFTSVKTLFWESAKQIPRFFHPATIIIAIYFVLLVPFAGIGPKLIGLEWVKIPSFIQNEISRSGVYSVLYFVALLMLLAGAVLLSFILPAMLFEAKNPWQAAKISINLVLQKPWKIVKEILRGFLNIGVCLAFAVALTALINILLFYILPDTEISIRFSVFFFLFSVFTIIAFVLFLVAPYEIRDWGLFFAEQREITKNNTVTLNVEPEKDLFRGVAKRMTIFGVFRRSLTLWVSILLMLSLAGLSLVLAYGADQIIRTEAKISVAAHRGGGNLAAENSLLGVQRSIDIGIEYAELDVQRTKDGIYIINHDDTFKRVAGLDAAAEDLSLTDVLQLKVNDEFKKSRPAQPVAQLTEVLDLVQNHASFGLFLELKGDTADQKMVDEVVSIIKERQLESRIVLMSLDYDLIKYLEREYPEIQSGYAYFFALGEQQDLVADWLILEEGLAENSQRISQLQEAGKRIAVWTVNSAESIEKFAGSEVDLIITDHPAKVARALFSQQTMGDVELILQWFFAG
ncbi:MAG: glycerophosphodiester phosphodiesterase family protein [Arcanobacterium sp.]|nr:glycerophosphodiester phosphodiesterase family protein [Arcanobacterium sp.]